MLENLLWGLPLVVSHFAAKYVVKISSAENQKKLYAEVFAITAALQYACFFIGACHPFRR